MSETEATPGPFTARIHFALVRHDEETLASAWRGIEDCRSISDSDLASLHHHFIYNDLYWSKILEKPRFLPHI